MITTEAPRTLVIGATSGTGALVTEGLLKMSRPVRIIARDPEKARARFNDRVEVVKADLVHAGEDFQQAFHDVHDVVFTAADTSLITPERRMREVDHGGVVSALMAAKKAPITGRFLYMNAVGTRRHSLLMRLLDLMKSGYSHWRSAAEDMVEDSGLPYVIVRAGLLNQAPAGGHCVRLAAGDRPLTLGTRIARGDVAEVFLAILQTPHFQNKEINAIWGGTQRSIGEQLAAL